MIDMPSKEQLHAELLSAPYARPADTETIKKIYLEGGGQLEQWNNISSTIETNQKIHDSIIFFMFDPQVALRIIPQRWYDLLPNGFVEFVDNVGSDLTYEGKRDLFRRTMYFEIEGPSKIMMADIHIDKFLEFIPDFMFDLLVNNPDDIDKIIAYCKERKQEDSVGYSKLLMLK